MRSERNAARRDGAGSLHGGGILIRGPATFDRVRNRVRLRTCIYMYVHRIIIFARFISYVLHVVLCTVQTSTTVTAVTVSPGENNKSIKTVHDYEIKA